MRDCFICDSAGKAASYARVGSHDYLRCGGCGLLYVDEIEPAENLYKAYDGGFLKSLRRKLFMPFRGFSAARHFDRSMERAGRILGKVQSLGPAPAARPAWLDIGCNKGFLLSAAIAGGFEAWGVEIVPELILPFQRKFKRFADNIFPGRFSDIEGRFREGQFNVVTAIDVIEHFEDPGRDLSRISRILAPGGLFLFQTPDTEHSLSKERGGKWGALKPLEHLHLFNRANLEVLSRKLGFKEIGFFEAFDREDGNLAGVMRK